jgi:hypothetical protein
MQTGFGWKGRRKQTTRKSRHMWGDNIKMNLKEIGWGSIYWIHLAQDRDQWPALVNKRSGLMKCWKILE